MNPGPNGGRWFPGATLNVCVNCLDRHLATVADGVAFHWEGEPGDRRAITYRELHAEVCAFAAALAGLGVGAGDRVALHLGFLPETVVAWPATQVHAVYGPLACGATSVIYEGERLGGLAHPRTIAFLEEFPEDLPRADLRRILRLLCATAASENISLTLEQLRAAARASRRA